MAEVDTGLIVLVGALDVHQGGQLSGPALTIVLRLQGFQIGWKAVDKHVVYNCSGSCTECCHDEVWMRDALEFYIAAGLNASWDPSVGAFGAHNVTEVDGGPMGGFWAGYMNNSGYNPTQPSILIDCSVPGLSWMPRITNDGFAAHLRVPWHILPGGKPEILKGSIWRLNFYRWDHGLDPQDVTVGNASAWSVTYCDYGPHGAHGEGCNPCVSTTHLSSPAVHIALNTKHAV